MSSKKKKRANKQRPGKPLDPAEKLARGLPLEVEEKRTLLIRAALARDAAKALDTTDASGEKLHERRGNVLMASLITVVTALVAKLTLADCEPEPELSRAKPPAPPSLPG